MWTPLLLVALGVTVVVLGILWLRLPAFLALILAAFTVAVCTPLALRENFAIERVGIPLTPTAEGEWILAGSGAETMAGESLVVLRREVETNTWSSVTKGAVGELESMNAGPKFARIQTETPLPADGPLLALSPDTLRKVQASAKASVGSRVSTGFGDACANIGLIIAMASLIGTCLLESGAADRIVRAALHSFGEQAAPLAFLASGFLLGIPVFFDTVFLLMIPLGKALHVRTARNYLLYVLTIICGATMAHSLVPPTPGPLAVGEELGVSLATMIAVGTVIGLGASAVGLGYALLMNRRYTLPLREANPAALEQLTATLQRPATDLPPLWLSLAPIVLPVLLITGKSVIDQIEDLPAVWNAPASMLQVLGDSNLCITLAALIALGLLVRQQRKSLAALAPSLRAALASAGEIILVTAAGGAFGATLRQTGISGLVESLPSSSPVLLCAVTFGLTVAIRAAQGSATVAMMTAAGIVSGIAQQGNLECHPVYLAMAIGCGSKPGMWMNDSGFLVITRMTGMTDAEGLKYVSALLTLMGVAGLGITLLGAAFWPNLGN